MGLWQKMWRGAIPGKSWRGCLTCTATWLSTGTLKVSSDIQRHAAFVGLWKKSKNLQLWTFHRRQHSARLGGQREARRLWRQPAPPDHLPVRDRHHVRDWHPLLDEPRGDQRGGLRQESRHLVRGRPSTLTFTIWGIGGLILYYYKSCSHNNCFSSNWAVK